MLFYEREIDGWSVWTQKMEAKGKERERFKKEKKKEKK